MRKIVGMQQRQTHRRTDEFIITVLDDLIEHFADVIKKHHGIEEFANPTRANQVCFYIYPSFRVPMLTILSKLLEQYYGSWPNLLRRLGRKAQ